MGLGLTGDRFDVWPTLCTGVGSMLDVGDSLAEILSDGEGDTDGDWDTDEDDDGDRD